MRPLPRKICAHATTTFCIQFWEVPGYPWSLVTHFVMHTSVFCSRIMVLSTLLGCVVPTKFWAFLDCPFQVQYWWIDFWCRIKSYSYKLEALNKLHCCFFIKNNKTKQNSNNNKKSRHLCKAREEKLEAGKCIEGTLAHNSVWLYLKNRFQKIRSYLQGLNHELNQWGLQQNVQ